MNKFTAKLEPVPHGGLFVIVPEKIAAAAGLAYGKRVRGTLDGVPYRSSLMKYSGVFHLGVHKATAEAAGVKGGSRVAVTIELDDEPLPTDTVPADLKAALAKVKPAAAAWGKLAPSARRGYVRDVMTAKKPETRAKRVAKIVATLRERVPARRTWKPRAKT